MKQIHMLMIYGSSSMLYPEVLSPDNMTVMGKAQEIKYRKLNMPSPKQKVKHEQM